MGEMRGCCALLAVAALLAGARCDIQIEMSVLTAENESAFLSNIAALSQSGRGLLNSTNSTNTPLLPEMVLAMAKIVLTRSTNTLCIDGVGCYNDTDLPPPSPVPSPASGSQAGQGLVLVGALSGAGVLVVGVLAYWLLRPSPHAPYAARRIKVSIDLPRNRGWVMR